MRSIALVAAGLLWFAPVQAKKPKTPRSSSAAVYGNATPKAKRVKGKKFKPTGRAKAKTYSNRKIARRHSQ